MRWIGTFCACVNLFSTMEVEVRVVRAHVWLSSSVLLHQDGFLSLTRVGGTEHVAHATLRSVQGRNGDQCSPEVAARQQGQKSCVCSVLVAWDEQSPRPGATCPRFSLPVVPVGGTRKEITSNQHAPLPRLDFQLFLLRPRSRGGTSPRSRPQTVYIGTSGWQLSEKDVEALVSSKEVVFLTTLQDELGTLEVKLRHASSSDTNKVEAARHPAAEDGAEVPTGFSINWSSSEALQKDLAEKARLKAEAEKKLIAQLKQTAAKAAKLIESRDYLLMHLQRSRAASRIQRRFRELQRKKQEIIDKLRQEEEARIAVKKAKVREKVVSRNRQRALAMRSRLREYIGDNNNSVSTQKTDPEDRMPAHEARRRIEEHVKTERAKLKERLAALEMQRRLIGSTQRFSAAESNQHSPQQRNGKLFTDDLVRAVQELHFNHFSQV